MGIDVLGTSIFGGCCVYDGAVAECGLSLGDGWINIKKKIIYFS